MKKLALAAALMLTMGTASAASIDVLDGATVTVTTGNEYNFATDGPRFGDPGVTSYTLVYNDALTSIFSLLDTDPEGGTVEFKLTQGASTIFDHVFTDLVGDATQSFSQLISVGTYTFTIFNNSTTLKSSTSGLSAVPLPGAAWLFGSGLLGFMMLSSRRKV